MTLPVFLLAAAFLAQQNGPPASSAPDPIDEAARFHFAPERFDQLRGQGFAWCGWSGLPNECRAAFLAASYSAKNVKICLERAGEPFARRHGGVATSFAQEEMARTCRAPIRMCRENWRHFFLLSSRDKDPRWTERQEAILSQNLNGQCGQEPSEHAQDR